MNSDFVWKTQSCKNPIKQHTVAQLLTLQRTEWPSLVGHELLSHSDPILGIEFGVPFEPSCFWLVTCLLKVGWCSSRVRVLIWGKLCHKMPTSDLLIHELGVGRRHPSHSSQSANMNMGHQNEVSANGLRWPGLWPGDTSSAQQPRPDLSMKLCRLSCTSSVLDSMNPRRSLSCSVAKDCAVVL